MKVNIVANFFPPEKGAAASRLYKLATMLQNRGVDVEVITALPNYPTGKIFKDYRWRLRKTEIQGGIKTKRYWVYPTNSSNPVARFLNMFSFSISLLAMFPYLRFFRKPDCVIVNSPPLVTGHAGVLIGRWSKAVVVANISDIWPHTALDMGAIRKGKMYSFLESLERFIYAKSHVWVTQSGESMEHILRHSDAKKPYFLYRNLDKTSPYLSTRLPYAPTSLKIVYAGLLGAAQGVYEICKRVDFKGMGIEFHIYGAGHDLALIQQYIHDNPGSNIYMHQPIPKEDVPLMLSQFHATIIPLSTRIYGAFPSKIFMAIASGLPVLFSGEGEGADVVEQYEIGWVNKSGDFETLAQNIDNLKKIGEDEYERIRQNCINACTSDFDFDLQTERFYQFLLDSCKKG